MRTIKNLDVAKETNLDKWPWSNIKNETLTEDGTPVVREIYGDILVNIYKILQDAGITPNETEDSEDSGYQFLTALKRFSNELNDIEKVISLSGTLWTLPIAIDNLPDKYVIFARVSDDYNSTEDYNIKGTDNNIYSFTSPTGFNASEVVLLVLDQSEVRCYSLLTSAESQGESNLFPVFGNPISFNNSDTIYYNSSGKLISDRPDILDIQNRIRVFSGSATIYVNEMFILQNYLLCFTFDESDEQYNFYQFPMSDLNDCSLVLLSGSDLPNDDDFSTYVYADESAIYMTNAANKLADDNVLELFNYKPADDELVFTGRVTLDASFNKTTNVAITSSHLVTFYNGSLDKFELTSGDVSSIGNFNSMIGQIFNYKNSVYYTNGEVAKKWNV